METCGARLRGLKGSWRAAGRVGMSPFSTYLRLFPCLAFPDAPHSSTGCGFGFAAVRIVEGLFYLVIIGAILLLAAGAHPGITHRTTFQAAPRLRPHVPQKTGGRVRVERFVRADT